MVTKPRYRGLSGEPPPIDESWWEAVLAEDEAQELSYKPTYSPQNGVSAEMTSRINASRMVSETAQMDWEKACLLYEQDQFICLQVNGYNRGGLLVGGEWLQGFVPISHLVNAPEEGIDPEHWLASYKNQVLRLKVIECDKERGRVVFSERAALAEPGSRKSLLVRLQPCDCVQGTVTNITDFGVFVDLGGVEGLVHVSEISWGRVRHPTDVVSLGQKVNVFVIKVERDRARVALSLKRLHPNPWETVQDRYYPGQLTEAVVTSVVPFGAFARLDEGLDGLIHISELCSSDGQPHPEDALIEGQKVQVRVLHVDGSKQRLGLSLRLDEKDDQPEPDQN